MGRRYFNEEIKCKPGVISDELKDALGISKRGLPIWIHRMRILGYPPGWLKKADMTNTTINFIDDNENCLEKGEIDGMYAEKKYNTDSFFEYPGFNSPVPKGVRDDYEKIGMPPMQEFQQLNYAKQTVRSIQPVPNRRVNFTDLKDKNAESSDSDEESSDNTDKKNKTLNLDSTINLSSDLNEDKEEEELSISSDSSEIIVLDVEKRNLCANISLNRKENTSISSTSSNLDSLISKDELNQKNELNNNESVIELSTIDKRVDKITYKTTDRTTNDLEKQIANENEEQIKDNKKYEDNQNVTTDDDQDVDHKDSDQVEERRESISSKITLVSMGAPVPASLNGEKPPLENFAVGMGELIYFENLPTSTGVFDKMRKVIKKIRKKLSNPSGN